MTVAVVHICIVSKTELARFIPFVCRCAKKICRCAKKKKKKKKKKNFTSFGQPTRMITCANHGNNDTCCLS